MGRRFLPWRGDCAGVARAEGGPGGSGAIGAPPGAGQFALAPGKSPTTFSRVAGKRRFSVLAHT